MFREASGSKYCSAITRWPSDPRGHSLTGKNYHGENNCCSLHALNASQGSPAPRRYSPPLAPTPHVVISIFPSSVLASAYHATCESATPFRNGTSKKPAEKPVHFTNTPGEAGLKALSLFCPLCRHRKGRLSFYVRLTYSSLRRGLEYRGGNHFEQISYPFRHRRLCHLHRLAIGLRRRPCRSNRAHIALEPAIRCGLYDRAPVSRGRPISADGVLARRCRRSDSRIDRHRGEHARRDGIERSCLRRGASI
jgi:hypothetical protein